MQIIRQVSPFVRTLLDDAAARNFAATLGSWYVLGAGAAAANSHTGNTNETTLATVTVPAGAMGANGIIRVTAKWTFTNGADDKTMRVRLGGTLLDVSTLTTVATHHRISQIHNRNSAASQVGNINGIGGGGWGSSTSAFLTGTVNTANAADITITAQLENGADTLTLESYLVELFYQA